MPHLAFASAMAIGLAATGTNAWSRPTHSSMRPRPPPSGTGSTAPTSWSSTYTKRSRAYCEATVSATTTATAQSAFGDVMASMTGSFCGVVEPYMWSGDQDGWKATPWRMDKDQIDLKIKALATLVLDSKIKCTTEGEYAHACGETWADAYSFAGASYTAFASAWADLNSGDNSCDCGNEVALSADAVTSGWGEIWTEISAGLDDRACAGSSADETFDHFPTEVDQAQKIECTGSVIVSAWAKAAAKLFIDGDCKSSAPTRCEACCVDPVSGDVAEGCTQEACETDCIETVYQKGKVRAEASVTSRVRYNDAECTQTLNDVVTEHFAPSVFDFTSTITGETGSASCEAESYSDVMVAAASGAAESVANLMVNFCEISASPAPIVHEMNGFVDAYVDVITGAYATCTATGGDPDFDGGCAFAKSFAKGYAEACASAVADAVVSSPGMSACDCNVNVQALGEAAAREVEIIFAELALEVEARACNPDFDGGVSEAEIVRQCRATTTADILAKSMASVVLEGSCIPGTKADYCATKCDGAEHWDQCNASCEADAAVDATTIVEAIADITVTVGGECNGEADDTDNVTGVQEVYVAFFETDGGEV